MGFFAPTPPKPPETTEEESPKFETRLDTVEQWRYDELLKAGYSETQALFLAIDRARPDLHEAVKLAKKAGPDLAYRIVST
jgi:hypothetical protein